MMKGSDAFERSVRDAMEHYEVPYNSADWNLLEKNLGEATQQPLRNGSAAMSMLLFAGVIAMVATSYVMLSWPVGQLPAHADAAVHTNIDHDVEATGAGLALVDRPDMTGSQGAAIGPVSSQGGSDAPANEGQARGAGQKKAAAPMVAKGPDAPAPTGKAEAEDLGIRASVSEGCPGEPISFELGKLPEDGMHLWNFGDGSFSNKAKPSHIYTKPGRYEVMLSHSSVGGGNFSNRPISEPLVIHEAPSASFQPIARRFDHSIPTVHFENRSMGGKQYEWDFGDGHRSTRSHPDHVYRTKGTYTAVLTVTNGNGCVDRAETRVVVDEDYNLNALTAFSPNSDGVNDTFMPEALRHLGIPFELTIYDAGTGQLLFTSDKPTDRWNGRVDNTGEKCPVGDYVWMVELKDGGKYGNFNGTVSLVR